MGVDITAPGAITAPGGQAGVHTGVHTGAGCTQTGSCFLRQQQQPTSPRMRAARARVAGILVSFMELSKFGGGLRSGAAANGGVAAAHAKAHWGLGSGCSLQPVQLYPTCGERRGRTLTFGNADSVRAR
jgi:hypothetical protein